MTNTKPKDALNDEKFDFLLSRLIDTALMGDLIRYERQKATLKAYIRKHFEPKQKEQTK